MKSADQKATAATDVRGYALALVPPAPSSAVAKAMHATLRFPDGSLLMGADCPPEYGTPFGGFSQSVNAKGADEAERLFAGISEGGKVTMPLEKTFSAERLGMCTDRFGRA